MSQNPDPPLFPDKSKQPQDDDIASILGRVQRYWDQLVADALEAEPAASPVWKYYMKKTGWTFVVRGKRRNLFYMRPVAKGRFALSLALGDRAYEAARQADLPDDLQEVIRQAPRYPEGWGVRMEVAGAADAKVARRLLAIKLER